MTELCTDLMLPEDTVIIEDIDLNALDAEIPEHVTVQELIAVLPPLHSMFAILMAAVGPNRAEMPVPLTLDKMRIKACKERLGLTEESTVDDRPGVQRLIKLLSSGAEFDGTRLIRILQESNLVAAQLVAGNILRDPTMDNKTLFKIVADIQDRDPKRRTLKQSVQRTVNESEFDENSPGILALKQACTDRRRIEGRAVERSLEFIVSDDTMATAQEIQK